MWVNGFADVGRVTAHLNGQRQFANNIPGVGADNRAADNAMKALPN